MKKTRLLPLVSVALVLTALAGCNRSVSEDTLVISCTKLGYGLDWLKALTKEYTSKTGVKFKIIEEIGENGIGSIDTQIKSYAGTSDIYGTRPSGFHKYIYRGQITAADGNVYQGVFENLNDVYDGEYEGESGKNTMSKKIDKTFKDYATVGDNTYAVPWANGFVSFCRNLDVWNKFGYSNDYYPRTTDEFFEVLDDMNSKIATDKTKFNNTAPLIYSEANEYYTTITGAWFAQYEGSDRMENFYEGLDPNGEQSDNFYAYQGITESANVLAKLLKKQNGSYVYHHSDSSRDFTQVQNYFLFGASAFMVNGTWLEVESPTARKSNIDWIKIPLVSSIINKLSFDNEETLRNLVTYVDNNPLDGNYTDMPSGVTTDDVDIVRDARNNGSVMRTDYDHLFVVPTWNHKKEMAKAFLKWMYSDEALQLFYTTMNGHHLPATLSQGEYSNEGITLSSFRIASNKIFDAGAYCPYLINTVKARMFSVAGVLPNFSNSIGLTGTCASWLAQGKVSSGEAVRKENSDFIKHNWDTISSNL